jgi:hypothetical protein
MNLREAQTIVRDFHYLFGKAGVNVSNIDGRFIAKSGEWTMTFFVISSPAGNAVRFEEGFTKRTVYDVNFAVEYCSRFLADFKE